MKLMESSVHIAERSKRKTGEHMYSPDPVKTVSGLDFLSSSLRNLPKRYIIDPVYNSVEGSKLWTFVMKNWQICW